jgi:hypothetical protein
VQPNLVALEADGRTLEGKLRLVEFFDHGDENHFISFRPPMQLGVRAERRKI